MMRESEIIRKRLANDLGYRRDPRVGTQHPTRFQFGGMIPDDVRALDVVRLGELERTTLLSRQRAREDLDAAAYYHVQPCYCDRCQ